MGQLENQTMNEHILKWRIVCFFVFTLLGLFGIISDGFAKSEPKSDFIVAIDAGHSLNHSGAVSARGMAEYEFNKIIADNLLKRLQKDGYAKSFIINPDGRDLTLRERADIANGLKANLLISIHHDSVQPQFLKLWRFNGVARKYSDRYAGFSVFYSELNSHHRNSLLFAKQLGGAMKKAGFVPTLHHAEHIPGEGRHLIDSEQGIYRVDGFGIVKAPSMPAVILECGIIVNRKEEARLANPEWQKKIITAIISAIELYYINRLSVDK
jgi:N-acetylmuramoyl-L-alanine amidase